MKWYSFKRLSNFKYIESAESFFKVKFPDDYKEIVLKYDGGSPQYDTFDTEKTKNETFSTLLSLDKKSANNLYEIYGYLMDKLPKGVIPFADDPGGNYICFDYRQEENPKIIFWNAEIPLEKLKNQEENTSLIDKYDIYFVADNFAQFIKSLRKNDIYFSDEDLDDAEILDIDE